MDWSAGARRLQPAIDMSPPPSPSPPLLLLLLQGSVCRRASAAD